MSAWGEGVECVDGDARATERLIQAAKADELVDEAIGVGHGRSDPLVTHAKMLRLELLNVKADLERELEDFVLNCSKCGLDVHWVSGLGVTPGHWAHREPAPHGEPVVS